MHPRWIAVLAGVGLLDLAYIDFVIGPRWFEASAARAASRAASVAPVPHRNPAAGAPAPAAPEAINPAAINPAAINPAAINPAAVDLTAVGHERPPGQDWWIVHFDEAGASLNPAAEQQLRQIAQRVAASHDVRINIIGHADARGASQYNEKLGERRARAVADALSHAGFRRDQIQITSQGAASPAVLGASQAAWASNRRAEIQIQAVPRNEPPRSQRP